MKLISGTGVVWESISIFKSGPNWGIHPVLWAKTATIPFDHRTVTPAHGTIERDCCITRRGERE